MQIVRLDTNQDETPKTLDYDEFNETFEEDLHKSSCISSESPNDLGTNVAPDADGHKWLIRSRRLGTLIHKISESLVIWSFYFLRIDILATINRLQQSPASSSSSLLLGISYNQNGPRRSTRKWPHALFATYLLAFSLLLVYTRYQYLYEARVFRLNKLRELLKGAGQNQQTMPPMSRFMLLQQSESILVHYEQLASEARKSLKSLGASHLEWLFAVTPGLIQIITIALACYVIAPICFSLDHLAFLSTGILFENNCTARIRARLILDELIVVSASSLLLIRTKLEEKSVGLSIGLSARIARDRFLALAGHNLRQRHIALVKQLKDIALGGKLNPPNRSAACKDIFALAYLILFCSALVASLGTPACVYQFLCKFFEARGVAIEYESVKDILMSLCVFYIYLICSTSAAIIITLHGLALIDQLVSVYYLRQLLLNTIKSNELKFEQLKCLLERTHRQGDCSIVTNQQQQQQQQRTRRLTRTNQWLQTKLARIRHAFEVDILIIVIQCRLVTKSFKRAKGLMSLVACLLTFTAMLVPIVLRLHFPYLQLELRNMLFLVGMVAMCVCLIFLGPMSLLHMRFVKTFKIMWSLSAQLSYFQSIDNINKCLMIEKSVAILTLRRELGDSRQSMDRFACRIVSLPVTYGNLIKIIFYLVLVLISFYDSSNKLFAPIGDPFGLLDDYLQISKLYNSGI